MTPHRPGEARRVLNDRPDPRDVAPDAGELGRAIEPLGAEARVLRVGALAFALRGLDQPTASLVDRRYEGFVHADAPAAARAVELGRAPRPRYLHLTRGGGASEEARMAARSTPAGIELWSYFFAGAFDRAGRASRLLACPGVTELDLAQAIENHLRFLVATAALAEGGFVLHAAGVVHAGRAVVFFGPSGAGKSTTASNAPVGCELLGDDLVLLEPHAGAWRACGVPFRGSFSRGANASSCAPLALACRLVQAPADRLETVPRIVQVAEVLGEMPFLADDAELRQRAAVTAERFVRGSKVVRLHLRRGPSYWSALGPALV